MENLTLNINQSLIGSLNIVTDSIPFIQRKLDLRSQLECINKDLKSKLNSILEQNLKDCQQSIDFNEPLISHFILVVDKQPSYLCNLVLPSLLEGLLKMQRQECRSELKTIAKGDNI